MLEEKTHIGMVFISLSGLLSFSRRAATRNSRTFAPSILTRGKKKKCNGTRRMTRLCEMKRKIEIKNEKRRKKNDSRVEENYYTRGGVFAGAVY